MAETRIRSGTKSLIWRLCGVVILATITYTYTRQWVTTGLITLIHHGVFLFVFYLHERLWLSVKRIQNLTYRSLLKMLTYETLCGNVILGTITYAITGNWKQMTAITLTYIGFKHVCYVFNEFIWSRVKVGTFGAAILLFLLAGSGTGFADYWTVNAIKAGDFKLSTEMRMDSNVYLRFMQLDWNYKVGNSSTITLSEREVRTTTAEHSPMVSLTYQNGFIKNRVRVQYRMRDSGNVVRFRDKVTMTRGCYFTAFEAFVEKGKWYRNRYYIGVTANKNLGFFFMNQTTNSVVVWVFGATFTAEVL